ncbi:hypothetical protein GCM10029964_015240 [Kibdelosporangium lantanae]
MRVFRDPASVAVVGATDNPAKWGHWLARGALTGVDRRDVYLVNARADSVLGHGVFRSLRDLPVVPELVVLAVPSADSVAEEAAELGVRGLVGITASVRVPVGRMRVLGPNCLGLYDSSAALNLAWGRFTPGPLAIVSQSGQVGMEIAGLAADHGLGVSRFVSVGDQVDVTLDEVLADLVDHAATRLVVLYAEDFGDGRALVRTLTRLRAAGKPVVVLTVGGSEASRVAAQSHTGALTSSLDVVDAACRAAGAVRVRTPVAAAGLAHILSTMEVTGDRVAIVTDSGGQGALAADLAADLGLVVPPLAVSLDLPERGSARNPVDLAGLGEQDLGSYGRIVGQVATEVDTVLLTGYFGCYGVDTPSLADREAEVAATFPPNVVVHSMATGGPAMDVLRRRGTPVFRDVDSALAALQGRCGQCGPCPGPCLRSRRLPGWSGPVTWRPVRCWTGCRFHDVRRCPRWRTWSRRTSSRPTGSPTRARRARWCWGWRQPRRCGRRMPGWPRGWVRAGTWWRRWTPGPGSWR